MPEELFHPDQSSHETAQGQGLGSGEQADEQPGDKNTQISSGPDLGELRDKASELGFGPADPAHHEDSQDRTELVGEAALSGTGEPGSPEGEAVEKSKASPEEVKRRVEEIKREQSDLYARGELLRKELERIDRENADLSERIEHPDGSVTVRTVTGNEWLAEDGHGLHFTGPDDQVGYYPE